MTQNRVLERIRTDLELARFGVGLLLYGIVRLFRKPEPHPEPVENRDSALRVGLRQPDEPVAFRDSVLYDGLRQFVPLPVAFAAWYATLAGSTALWLFGPYGERANSALAYLVLAAAAAAAWTYRAAKLSRDRWPESIWGRSVTLAAFGLEGLLVGLGAAILPHALGLEPHTRWTWAFIALGAVASLVAHRKRLRENYLDSRAFLRLVAEDSKRLGGVRAALDQENTPELEARLAALRTRGRESA